MKRTQDVITSITMTYTTKSFASRNTNLFCESEVFNTMTFAINNNCVWKYWDILSRHDECCFIVTINYFVDCVFFSDSHVIHVLCIYLRMSSLTMYLFWYVIYDIG